ncbi:MAG: 2-nitropropane dioxygenase, partial [Bradymonadaceae bacterium]
AVADVAAEHGYDRPLRVGAAGGLGTPAAVASALALGADYVVTGSVNQATVESGLSDAGKRLLAEADPAETETAPSADRFEQGADVQVLGRGTMFAQRANRLGRLYRRYDSLEDLPAEQIEFLEEELFDAPLGEVREQTRAYWKDRAPEVADRARRDGRREMALVFRRYLGRSSSWAFEGAPDRRADYQIWCGPAMGAFNRWVEGSFLEDLSERTVGQIARNLLEGAAVATRGQQLRNYGVPVPARAFEFEPRPLEA